MKSIGIILAAGLALVAGACTQDNYGPYYGPSQGYVYPSKGYGYYGAQPYYQPAHYGYRSPYGGHGYGPSITFTLPAGNLP